MNKAHARVADLLDRLANGDTVALGEFGDNSAATDADDEAAVLRDLADKLRE